MQKIGKRFSVIITLAVAFALMVSASAMAATSITDVNVNLPNFNQPVGSDEAITASAVGGENVMYQWWVKGPADQDAKCLGPWSQDNTFDLSQISGTAGTYEFYLNAADAADYADGNVDPANVCTKYFKVYIGTSVALNKAEISGGNLVVEAAASGFANPVYQFWYQLQPDGDWKCSGYGGGASRTIDLAGATGTYKVIAYAKDKDAIDGLKYTVWSDVQEAGVGAAAVTADVTVTSGALGFKEVVVNSVEGLTGAASFKVEESSTVKALGEKITFLASGDTTTLYILDAGGNTIAQGTLDVSASQSLTVDLTSNQTPPTGDPTANVTVTAGALGFKDVTVNSVENLSGATSFKVEESTTVKAIGGKITFLAGGDTTTLYVLDAGGNVLGSAQIDVSASDTFDVQLN